MVLSRYLLTDLDIKEWLGLGLAMLAFLFGAFSGNFMIPMTAGVVILAMVIYSQWRKMQAAKIAVTVEVDEEEMP